MSGFELWAAADARVRGAQQDASVEVWQIARDAFNAGLEAAATRAESDEFYSADDPGVQDAIVHAIRKLKWVLK